MQLQSLSVYQIRGCYLIQYVQVNIRMFGCLNIMMPWERLLFMVTAIASEKQ